MNKISFCAVALTLATLSAPSAFASDGKVYAGSTCKGLNAANADILYTFSNYAENTSNTNSALVMCPITKDIVAGTYLQYIRVSFSKEDSTGLYCAVYGRNATGGGSFVTSKWDFDGAGARNMVLPDVDVHASGSISMYCIIPPGGRIQSYRIDEQ